MYEYVRLLRELLRVLNKFQSNFGIIAIINCEVTGLLDQYISTLFGFTMGCLESASLPTKQQILAEVMSNLHYVWQQFHWDLTKCKVDP